VEQISFANNGAAVMNTVKSYDALNRLTNIVSGTNDVALFPPRIPLEPFRANPDQARQVYFMDVVTGLRSRYGLTWSILCCRNKTTTVRAG
jgi:hypothetical protein